MTRGILRESSEFLVAETNVEVRGLKSECVDPTPAASALTSDLLGSLNELSRQALSLEFWRDRERFDVKPVPVRCPGESADDAFVVLQSERKRQRRILVSRLPRRVGQELRDCFANARVRFGNHELCHVWT